MFLNEMSEQAWTGGKEILIKQTYSGANPMQLS